MKTYPLFAIVAFMALLAMKPWQIIYINKHWYNSINYPTEIKLLRNLNHLELL